MKILFDQGTPVPLRRHLHPHDVDTADEQQWGTLQLADLLNAAEKERYDLLITTDQNPRYQQHHTTRKIQIVVEGIVRMRKPKIPSLSWRRKWITFPTHPPEV